jgi:hypothetical protein
MPADLTILVPTTRPAGAERLAEAAYRLSEADMDLVFVVNQDDYQSYSGISAGRVIYCPPGERGLVHPLNWGFKNVELGEAVGFFGDDVVPKSRGWDRKLLRQLRRQGSGLVYGNDRLQGRNIATHPILDSRIPQELGWLAYPALKHLCVDVVLHRMAADLGVCTYLDFVILEHKHRANGKAPSDDTYEYVNSESVKDHDGRVHLEYLNSADYLDDLRLLRGRLDL